jgi:hypothetical protein
MKVLSALVFALVFATGAFAAESSNTTDECRSFTPHGIWDCR